jgi:hypothetical protein
MALAAPAQLFEEVKTEGEVKATSRQFAELVKGRISGRM